MSDLNKFFDVVTELFKDSTIDYVMKVSENGVVYHWFVLDATFPINEIHRHEIFLEQLLQCGHACWVSTANIKRNNKQNCIESHYEIGTQDINTFYKITTEKLAWSAYSQAFDTTVEEQLDKTE